MKIGIAQDTAKSAKTLAQQIAKQIAAQPGEILKDAKEQITGEESSPRDNPQTAEKSDDQKRIIEEQQKLNDQLKSGRRMEALQKEIEDIRNQDKFSELQKRISRGEEIPLEEYPELSPEQKQVLQAQMEAYKVQNSKFKNQNFQEVPVINSKPSRRFGAGQKSQAQKEQTHVEKPVPPSG